jgi:hypothetical protein
MAARMELVTEEFCGWPYYQPYTYLRKVPRKPRAPKSPTAPKRKRKPKVTSEVKRDAKAKREAGLLDVRVRQGAG